jgi:hypothetical protein
MPRWPRRQSMRAVCSGVRPRSASADDTTGEVTDLVSSTFDVTVRSTAARIDPDSSLACRSPSRISSSTRTRRSSARRRSRSLACELSCFKQEVSYIADLRPAHKSC